MDYSYIIIPIIVGITSQAIKLMTDKIKGNFDLKHMLISYGGMPSTHTAFSVSILTLIGLRFGADSPIFAVTMVFTILVIRDAISFRNMLGYQGKLLNKLMDKMSAADKKDIPRFRERMGHSIGEVAAGAGLGIVLTFLLNLI